MRFSMKEKKMEAVVSHVCNRSGTRDRSDRPIFDFF